MSLFRGGHCSAKGREQESVIARFPSLLSHFSNDLPEEIQMGSRAVSGDG